jgi:hypothetical protein
VSADSVDGDAPLGRSGPAPDGSQGAAVFDGGQDQLVLNRPVGQAVDAVEGVLADPLGDVAAAGHHHVSSERGDQFGVGFAGVGDDTQAVGFGQLDDVAAVGPGRAGDRDGLTGLQGQLVEAHPGGETVHGHGRGVDEVGSGWDPSDGVGRDHDLGRVGTAQLRGGQRDGHHRVANMPVDAVAYLVDLAGRVHAWHVR